MKLCERCGACFDDDYDLCGFDGGILTPLFPGPRVIGGRYLLEQRVAGGAMGVVMRATHLQVGSAVAVKLMRPAKEDTHVALARFQREAQILGQIKHPNAVLVIDFGVEQRGSERQPYLVMEYLRGESLLALLEKKGRLTLEELERILVPLCDAVEEAHAVGVIHRDIKPSNVVLERLRDGSEIVKVLDFGIAKFISRGPRAAAAGDDAAAELEVAPSSSTHGDGDDQEALDDRDLDELDELAEALAEDDDFLEEVVATREEAARPTLQDRRRAPPTATHEGPAVRDPTTEAGFMIGTVPYMAPEQMTGERISVRTDVHAVAVVAFQCLAGRLPYDGDDEDIIAAKLSDERPSLRELGVEVPAEVDEVLQRAFALSPAERPGAVREIAEAVRAAVRRADTRGGDAATQAVVQIGAVGRSLTLVESAARAWLESTTGEEHYGRARDVMLAIDGPLRRIKGALDAASLPLPAAVLGALGDARRTLEGHVSAVRRTLSRIEPRNTDAEYADYLYALWTRIDLLLQEIIDALATLSDDDDNEADAGLIAPALLFSARAEPRQATVVDLAERLLARDVLESVDAVEELLDGNLDHVVLALGPSADAAVAVKLARGLWRHADTLLLHELKPQRQAFRLLSFLAGLRELPAAAPFALLARALSNPALDAPDVDACLAELERPEERAVLARCLLVHPAPAARERAVTALEISELWNVISHPSTPVGVLDFLFGHIVERAPNEYLKVFFLCARESLRSASSSTEIAGALRLLARFFRVPCFHEDIVFEPLLELDRTLRQRAGGLAQKPPDLDEDGYAEALAAFTAAGVRENRPLEHMRDIPLPIQRKLAREGRFLHHFVSHTNDRVARETLPHLFRLEDVTLYLRIPTIHRLVLTEIAKRKRFFRKDPPRLALLQNPKTPALVARMFLPLVSEEQLRLLSTYKHINPDVRRLITTTLTRPRQ